MEAIAETSEAQAFSPACTCAGDNPRLALMTPARQVAIWLLTWLAVNFPEVPPAQVGKAFCTVFEIVCRIPGDGGPGVGGAGGAGVGRVRNWEPGASTDSKGMATTRPIMEKIESSPNRPMRRDVTIKYIKKLSPLRRIFAAHSGHCFPVPENAKSRTLRLVPD